MFDTNMVITVDKDVSVDSKPIRGVDPADPRIPQLKALAIGDSFFVADAKGKEARPLVTLAKKIGVILLAREVKLDEIYLKPGVRIWRIEDPKNPQPATPEVEPEQVTPEVEPEQVHDDEPVDQVTDVEPETPAAVEEDDDL